MINAINSIDKHSLREVEGEILVYRIYTVTRGGTPLQEPNGDVPLDGVAFSQLE